MLRPASAALHTRVAPQKDSNLNQMGAIQAEGINGVSARFGDADPLPVVLFLKVVGEIACT